MHFSLIDKVTALEPGRSITAVKNLTRAEEYLQDHFPGFPVMPGVLMVEALVQAGAWLMRASTEFRYSTALLKQAKAVKFNNFVTPGKSLTVTLTVHEQTDALWTFKATGTVDGASAVSARLIVEQFNLGDRNPALQDSDQRRIDYFRQLFQQVWTPPTA